MKKTILAVVWMLICSSTLRLFAEPPARPEPEWARSRSAAQAGDEGESWSLGELRQNDPERFDELMRLRREDPQAFRQAIREELRKGSRLRRSGAGPRFATRHREIKDLVERFQDAESEEESARLRQEIRQLLADEFDRRVERHREHIEALSERLERMREELAEQSGRREQLIESQLRFWLEGEPEE